MPTHRRPCRRPRRLPRLVLLLAAALGWSLPASAAPPDAAGLETLARDAAAGSWESFRALLSLPNDAHFPDQVAANVAWMRHAFETRGFTVHSLDTAGAPLLLAEESTAAPHPAATRTVLVYFHLDGQPVDPGQWHQADPYRPVLKERAADGWQEIDWQRLHGAVVDPEWRVFARSAADDKGPAAGFLAALDAARAAGLERDWKLKVVMDFEEELGSPNLPSAVARHRDALAADLLLILDGPRHASNRPSLYFGARGIATITLRVFGPRLAQHSGHYGNYAPNPALRLAQLLASMKDAEGRVTIAGFTDGVVLDPTTRALLATVPDDTAEIHRRLGIAVPDAVGGNYQESLQYPSLNVRGLASAWVGSAARTIVPADAVAEIDLRLVPEISGQDLVARVRAHVEAQGYHLIAGEQPSDEERARYPRLASFTSEVSYGAFRTAIDSPAGRFATRALERGFGEVPVRHRILGGSVPIAPFVEQLGVPAVGVPGVQVDNNQHSPNENLRVGNYVDAIRTFLAILSQPFGETLGDG